MAVWRTEEEIAFLQNLGRFAGLRARAALLRRYLAQMKVRRHWGRIDPEIVESYIRLELGEGGKP